MSYVLSTHFALPEFTQSATAAAKGIDNTPPESIMPLLKEFCEQILEPIRAQWGAVVINSGYRCPELNAAVGGVPTSEHVWTTEQIAVDIRTPQAKLEAVFDWLRLKSGLRFDQVILERGKIPDSEGDDCIHIGYRLNPRRMALSGETNNRSGYKHLPVVVNA